MKDVTLEVLKLLLLPKLWYYYERGSFAAVVEREGTLLVCCLMLYLQLIYARHLSAQFYDEECRVGGSALRLS